MIHLVRKHYTRNYSRTQILKFSHNGSNWVRINLDDYFKDSSQIQNKIADEIVVLEQIEKGAVLRNKKVTSYPRYTVAEQPNTKIDKLDQTKLT